MNQFLKELLTAYCDEKTGKIYNCQKGSFVYFHELGHQRQYKSKFFGVIGNYTPFIGLLLIVLLAQERNLTAIYIVILILIYISAIELDAWAYAIRRYYHG